VRFEITSWADATHRKAKVGFLAALVLGVLAGLSDAQPHYDLLLKGGHVIDAKNNILIPRERRLGNLFGRSSRASRGFGRWRGPGIPLSFFIVWN
jgi:hypothetical protein